MAASLRVGRGSFIRLILGMVSRPRPDPEGKRAPDGPTLAGGPYQVKPDSTRFCIAWAIWVWAMTWMSPVLLLFR